MNDFLVDESTIWLNSAHQGLMPAVAEKAATEALDWKTRNPEAITGMDRFMSVPQRLRGALARLIDADPEEIMLANSASYGLHLLANGLQLGPGDEVLLVRGDFPSDILPWLGLQEKGVTVRYVEPKNGLPTPDEIASALNLRTRVFCTTWVHSFSGVACDLETIGRLCRENDTLIVANVSQALGTREFSTRKSSIDAAVSVGFKWLCGPYGTGFTWIAPHVLETITINRAYWLNSVTDLNAEAEIPPPPRQPRTSSDLDVFGTANFLNYVPWTAALEYLLDIGIPTIAEHNQALVTRLINGLDTETYEIHSPRLLPSRSTLVFLSHRAPGANSQAFQALNRSGIHGALRGNQIRLAPHLYNTNHQIDETLSVLNQIK